RSVTGLNCNTGYYYRVRAGNSCGSSSNSNAITLTTSATLSAPAASAASSVSQPHFSANWGSVSGATTYFLDVSSNSSFSSFLSGYNNLNVGNVTTYSVTGLTC